MVQLSKKNLCADGVTAMLAEPPLPPLQLLAGLLQLDELNTIKLIINNGNKI